MTQAPPSSPSEIAGLFDLKQPNEPAFSAGLARLARATIVFWAALLALRLSAFADAGVGSSSITLLVQMSLGVGLLVLLSLPAWQQPRRLFALLGFASVLTLPGTWSHAATGGVFTLWNWPLMTLLWAYTLAAAWQLWPGQRRRVQVLGALLALAALSARLLAHLPGGDEVAYQFLIRSFTSSLAVYAVAAVCLHGLGKPGLRERTQRAALGVLVVSVALTLGLSQLVTLGLSGRFDAGALSAQLVAFSLVLLVGLALTRQARVDSFLVLLVVGLVPIWLVVMWRLGAIELPLLTMLGVGLALLPRRWWALQALALAVLAGALLAAPGLGAPFATMFGLSALVVFALMRHWVMHGGLLAAADSDPTSGAPNGAPSSAEVLRLNRWSLGVGLATVLGVLALGGLVLQQRAHMLAQDDQEAMVLMTEQIQRRMYRAEVATQVMAQDIRDHVGSQPHALSEQVFKSMAEPLSRLVGPGVDVAWAPKGVITNVYANDGNLAALGLDLLNDPRRRDQFAPIRAQGKPVWTAPFVLVEGAMGMGYYLPLFATDGSFLGFVRLLLRLPQALLPDFEHPGRKALHSVALGLQPEALTTIWQSIDGQIEAPSGFGKAVSEAVSQPKSETVWTRRMALVGEPGGAGQWRAEAAPQMPARLWLEVRALAPQSLAPGLLLLQVALGLGLLAGLLTEQVLQARVRRQTQRQTNEELGRLQAVLGQSMQAMLLFNRAGRVVWHNQASLTVLAFAPERLQSFSLWNTPMMQVPQHQAALQRTLQTGQSCQFAYQGLGHAGQTLDVVVNFSRLELGETLVLLQAQDMYEVHARERDLEQANTRAQQALAEAQAARTQALAARDEVQDLYDNAPCGYHSLDPHGRVLRINQTELAWLQRRAEEVIGRSITDFMTPASVARFPALQSDLLAGQVRQNVEFELVRADGSIFEVAINAVMMKDAAGQPTVSSSTVFDITEPKAREYALMRARDAANAGNEAKTQFLSTISHEIRTPLNWLMGMLQILAFRDDLPKSAADEVNTAKEGAQVLLAVLNDVLDYSGLSSGKQPIKPAPMRITDSLMYIRMLGKKMPLAEHVTLLVEADPTLNKKVLADDLRLRQILLNLVSNAVKFTEQGQVRLSARVVALTESQMGVQIVVEDSGIGMSQETLAKLFTPFTQADMSDTRRHGGTGLGLAISKGLIDAMGGQVAVKSQLGVGTTFTIDLTLPLAPEEIRPPKIQATQKPDMAMLQADQDEQARKKRFLIETAARAKALVQAVASEAAASKPVPADVLPEAKPEAKPASVPKPPDLARAPKLDALRPPQDLPGQLQGLRVLVVDDDPSNVRVGEIMLTSLGAQVTACLGAQLGLQQLQDPEQSFELVLMDLQMPTLDGLEATRLIRQHPDPRVRDVLVLAMTGRLMNNERELARQAGMNGFISKPLLWGNLLSEIQQALAERDARARASS